MSKIVFRKLKPLDIVILVFGVAFALLLLAALIAPMINSGLSTFCKYATEPLGGLAFLALGIFVMRNQEKPNRNFGYFLIAAGAFSLIITVVMLVKLMH